MAEVKIPDHVDKAWCDTALDYDAIAQFRKASLTRAIRMAGPFTVETSEGPLRCEDGWLCFDVRGYPYPVAADEFALIYEPAPSQLEPHEAREVHALEAARQAVTPGSDSAIRVIAAIEARLAELWEPDRD